MIFRSIYKKPIFLVGNGIRAANCQDLLLHISEKYNIPVVTTMNAVDLVQNSRKLGFIGTYGNRCANLIVKHSDLVISLGARLSLRQTGHKLEFFAPDAKLIRVEIDTAEISKSVKTDEEKYNIDVRQFLLDLSSENISDYSHWFEKCIKVKDLLSNEDRVIGNIVIEKISECLPENPIVAVDVGQNQVWSAQSLHLRGKNGRILIAGGYGSMGCALPFAIGAAIATEDSVFCICGDGGFQMNIQELQVVARDNLPIKICVLNNNTLGKISEIQRDSYSSRFAQTTKDSGYTVPDFEKIAVAYGIRAATLTSVEAISDYKTWFTDNESCLLNILLPEDTLLIPKIAFDSSEILPPIGVQLQATVDKMLSSKL